jgi:hypothetical protein
MASADGVHERVETFSLFHGVCGASRMQLNQSP